MRHVHMWLVRPIGERQHQQQMSPRMLEADHEFSSHLITGLIPTTASDNAAVRGHAVHLKLDDLGDLPAHGILGPARQAERVRQFLQQTSRVVVTVTLVAGDG